MNADQIAQLKQQLQQERTRLSELVERTAKHLYRREEPYNQDFAEQAVETQNNEVVEHIDDEARAELALINHALTRIDNGDYTSCESCGEDIDVARLQAIPYTNQCIRCASAKDN